MKNPGLFSVFLQKDHSERQRGGGAAWHSTEMKTPQQQKGRCLTSWGRLGGGKHASPHAPRELKSSLNDYFPSRRITEHTQRTHFRKRPLQSHRDARAQALENLGGQQGCGKKRAGLSSSRNHGLQGDSHKLQMTRKSSN